MWNFFRFKLGFIKVPCCIQKIQRGGVKAHLAMSKAKHILLSFPWPLCFDKFLGGYECVSGDGGYQIIHKMEGTLSFVLTMNFMSKIRRRENQETP